MFGPSGTHACKEVQLLEHEQAKDKQHVLDKLKEIESLGGEGLMLRREASYVDPSFLHLPMKSFFYSLYEGRRSGTLLKIKVVECLT